MTPAVSDELLTLLQAAAESKRHPETLRKAAQKGELAHVRERHTRRLLFRTDDLQRWIASMFEEVPVKDPIQLHAARR